MVIKVNDMDLKILSLFTKEELIEPSDNLRTTKFASIIPSYL